MPVFLTVPGERRNELATPMELVWREEIKGDSCREGKVNWRIETFIRKETRADR